VTGGFGETSPGIAPTVPMTELSREEIDGMMFSEGNERSQKKRLLDDGRGNSMIGAIPNRKYTVGVSASPGFENQNFAYMDQESMMSFQKGTSLIGQVQLLDTSVGT
jgi:hypothetical protein